jgi:hypothetical protein
MVNFGELPAGDYDIYLKINDPKETTPNKRSIRFANKGDNIWNADLGANLIGSTTVNPAQPSNGGSHHSGGKTSSSIKQEKITRIETLKDGTVVTTITDDATGAQKITIKNSDGTVAEIDKPKSGSMIGKITLGSNTKETVVAIPMKDTNGGTVAIITHEDGTEEIIKGSVANDGVFYVPATRDVTIKIVQNKVNFVDANQAAWAKDAIDFVTAREMFLGTSSKEFSPNRAMTRGMLATVFYRLAGEPSVGANSFTDVDEGKYYTNAVAWAAKSGIVAGVGDNRFDQDREVTREQLVTMLYRYVGSPAVSPTLSGFNDAGQVSDWAKPAFAWALEQGIIRGRTETSIVPGANATRSEVAAMLQRFVIASTTN